MYNHDPQVKASKQETMSVQSQQTNLPFQILFQGHQAWSGFFLSLLKMIHPEGKNYTE